MWAPAPAMIIGSGTIGGKLAGLLAKSPEWDLRHVLTSYRLESGGHGFRKLAFPFTENPFDKIVEDIAGGVVFLAIPTRDRGEAALRYALAAVRAGACVVTAEKGMAAWQFEKIAPYLDMIDLGAAVGGGNRFLYSLRDRHLRDKSVIIRAVFNATMNFLATVMNAGGSLEDAVSHASKIGIAEPLKPGDTLDPIALLGGELGDVAMKIAAFYNFVLAKEGEYLRPDALGEIAITEEDVERLLSPNDSWRFVITITNQHRHADRDNDLIAPMKAEIGGWYISAGFKRINPGSPLALWLATVGGINNGVQVVEGGHTYSFSGPGAGLATVDAMLIGADRLLTEQRDRLAIGVRTHHQLADMKQQSG